MNWLNWKTIIVASLLVFSGLYVIQMLQAPDRILQDVFVYDEGNRSVLQVKFSVPVRYESHVPEKRGRVLNIKLRVVAFSGADRNDYIDESTIVPGFMEKVPVTDIAYEGDVPGGPLLSIRFSEPVSFKIAEDSSLRSLLISIPKRR